MCGYGFHPKGQRQGKARVLKESMESSAPPLLIITMQSHDLPSYCPTSVHPLKCTSFVSSQFRSFVPSVHPIDFIPDVGLSLMACVLRSQYNICLLFNIIYLTVCTNCMTSNATHFCYLFMGPLLLL